MKVLVCGRCRNYWTVWLEGCRVRLIDQTILPYRFRIHSCRNYLETADAIKTMVVRGAPAIGATAAYGVAQAVRQFRGRDKRKLDSQVRKAVKALASTRPTAFDLFYALDYMQSSLSKVGSVAEARRMAVEASESYANASAEKCRLIGVHGEKLIKPGYNILTHCNAGALGCVDYGTALAPMRFAHYSKKKFHVFVDETRPRLQGAYLTAWELQQEGIKHSVIADNAAGYYMAQGEVDLVIVGADRVARNGDVANKIGTYEKAVLAKENGIPFYVAAPSTTFDPKIRSGKDIPIEERSPDEVHLVQGKRITPKNSRARNPAFDVTPAKYIKGIITEKGILKPGKLK